MDSNPNNAMMDMHQSSLFVDILGMSISTIMLLLFNAIAFQPGIIAAATGLIVYGVFYVYDKNKLVNWIYDKRG